MLLTGCNPVDGCVKNLLSYAMWYLADEMSDVFHEPLSPHWINFYFVDVPSWFDLSLTDLRKDDPRRLD